MKIETIFYLFGGFFAIAAILYFTWEYILSFPKEIKTLLLVCLVILFFFLGSMLKERSI